jgi:integrase
LIWRKRRHGCWGCSVGTRPDGSLRLRFRWQGKALSVATGLDDTAQNRRALEPLRELIAATIRAGHDPLPLLRNAYPSRSDRLDEAGPAPTPGLTVAEYFATWISEQAPVVRKAQARDYRRHMVGYVLPVLGCLAMAELKPGDVRGLQADLLSRDLSVKYVKNIISGSFRAMIQQAKVDELVTRDVFVGLKWPRWRPPEPAPFTPEERTRIIGWFKRKRFGFHPGRTSSTNRFLPHPAYYVYVHLLFWSGLRPSEASGLQWGDVDLDRAQLHVRRSRHLYDYGAPKTQSADRWVELFPQTVRLLDGLQPLKVSPEVPVFTNTIGLPIEPKAFSRHWYDCLRALGIQQRGLYCTKNTFVTSTLTVNAKIVWLENQTGVNYATLRRHYGKWMPSEDRTDLRRFEILDRGLFEGAKCVRPEQVADTVARKRSDFAGPEMRGGGLEPPRVFSPLAPQTSASAISAILAH